ncbi:MAG: leucine-rich repeat domain-containing protein [Chitinophagales bacterium]
MKIAFYTFICLLFISSIFFENLFGQNPIPLYRGEPYKTNEHSTLFFNEYGSEVFKLPPSARFVTTHPKAGAYNMFIDDLLNQSLDPYYNDICVVKWAGHRWIDKRGQTLIDFRDKYANMGRFINGYAMAWRRLENSRGYKLTYLNEKGENAFGNKEFLNAAPFSEGMAAVRPTKEEGWGWMDKTGEIILKPKDIEQSHIVKLFGFSDGLAKVIVKIPEDKKSYNRLFVNTDGHTVLNINSIFSGRDPRDFGHFHGGLLKIPCYHPKEEGTSDVYYINTDGKMVHKFEKVARASKVVDDLFYIETRIPAIGYPYRSQVDFFNAKGDTVKLNIPDSLKIKHIKKNGRNLIELRLKGRQESINAIYSREKDEIVATCENSIMGFTNNRILLKNAREDYYQLRDFAGQIIWESDVSKRAFTDISEALKVKDKVRIFKSNNESDFENGLLELTNLEYLRISSMERVPPEIGKCTNLKKLEISSFKKLGILPNEISKLPKLERLDISYCDNYEGGIENIVRNSPNLKILFIEDVKLPEGFEEKIKQLKSSLRIKIEQPTIMDLPVYPDR